MKKTKCLIVDDEPAAHYVLQNYIKQNPQLELVHQCYNGIEALNYLRSNSVDLMFLDIDMPEITGLELLATLPDPPTTILTTAYSEFALKSYDFGVFDYLLKPIFLPRFIKSVERFLASQKVETASDICSSFLVKVDGAMVEIDFQDVLFAQSYGNYVKIFCFKKIYVASITTSELESLLNTNNFMRIHKSYIVAIDKIKSFDKNNILIGEETIPIGITYKRALSDKLKSE
ncbi:LytR/AlgR family response regulator transcription factor [Flavobacterium ardleyense]|uniref:LytR/AlgR family response regulator transcription factor n=1 Tax=Flavobacterium ardleyense TaxID=2038737 RepID=UPI00298D1E05|nr:LytTR family DNA-binding domain-containing protein [Flavobacterium ardleyense]